MPSDLFEELRTVAPEPARIVRIQQRLSQSLKPVSPLPSDGAMLALLLIGYLALVIAATLPVGFGGFRSLNNLERVLYLGLIAASAWMMAQCLIGGLVPASTSRVSPVIAVLLPLFAIPALVFYLFPDRQMQSFLETGVPCLRLGSLAAVPCGALAAVIVRRGYVTDWKPTAILAGALAGMAGIGVLALHCPIQNALHILTWHMGVIVITIAAGAIIGGIAARRFK